MQSSYSKKCSRIVFFFDNDINNFKDRYLCTCVIPVLIPQTEKKLENGKGVRKYMCSLEIYSNYINSLTEGAQIFGRIRKKRKIIDNYDPKSGISINKIDYYIKKINKYGNEGRISSFIFDWDRTLTLFEGVPCKYKTLKNLVDSLNKKINQKKKTTHSQQIFLKPIDIVEYYFGGLPRISKLKKMINICKKYNIIIYILSANKGVNTNKIFFMDMLSLISGDDYIKSENIIWRNQANKSRTKYEYIYDILPQLCNGK